MSGTRLILFLVIVGGLDVSLHYYLWGRLVRDAELSERGRLLGTVFFVLVASLVLVRFVTFRVAGMEGALASALSWVTYIWLGCLFYLFWLTLAGDVVRPVVRIGLGKPDDDGPVQPDAGRLSRDNRALLQEALFDLLECKRLLDQVR